MSHWIPRGIGWALAIAGTVSLVTFASLPPLDRPRAVDDHTFLLEFIEEQISVRVEMDSSAGVDVAAGPRPDGGSE